MSLAEHEAEFYTDTPAGHPPPSAKEPEGETAPDPHAEARSEQARSEAEAANPNIRYEAPLANETPRDEAGQFRRRSAKKQASAADVPRIQELTKKWRGEEEAHAATKARAEQLERELQTLRTPQPSATPAATSFSEPEPDQDALILEGQQKGVKDPYHYAVRQMTAWDRRREAFETAQTTTKAQTEAQTKAQVEREITTYRERATAFAATKPDFSAKVDGALQQVPELLGKALITLDNGPEIAYKLSHRPELVAELYLLTEGKTLTDAAVRTVQQVLTTRLGAGSTGAAPAQIADRRAPRPPTPVRTGPLPTGSDLPGDGASLADHEAHYYPRRRR